MPDLPSGTVTFLFTDIARGFPRALWERDRASDGDKQSSAIWPCLMRPLQVHGGVLFKTIGDAVQAAFSKLPMRSLLPSMPSDPLLAEGLG